MNSRKIELENVWFILILNIKTVRKDIDCRWQVFLPQYAEFSATTSDAIIWKTEDFFLIFYSISKMCMKFQTFLKKRMSVLA